ncbi:YncE family protein [Methylorubrum extorquens]|uniref:YncE family protein n=1 Tax=Methylorubrum extorquens TaxID=408 RepID=UPI0011BDE828|nr:YncE family protein [Methylorubrum extorquens]
MRCSLRLTGRLLPLPFAGEGGPRRGSGEGLAPHCPEASLPSPALHPRGTLPRRGGRAFIALAYLLTSGAPALAQEALVTAQLGNAVEIIDLASKTILQSIPVPGAPAGIAVSPDRKTAYVTRPEGHGVSVIDLDARRVSASLDLPGGPLGIGVNPKSGEVYVADWYGARVFVLRPNAAGLTLEGEIATGKSPSGIAVTPDGATLLVANRESDSVSIIDVGSRRETRHVPVGQHPFGLTLSADGRYAYTANVVSNDVSAIDVAAGRETGRVATGQRPYVIAFAAGKGFVTDQYSNTVTVFDPASLKKVAAIDVGDHPEGIAATRDGKTIVVANWGDNALSLIDPSSLTVTGTIATGDGPRAFGDFLR